MVTIDDALPLKAARRNAIAKLKSFWGFESELQTNEMPFSSSSSNESDLGGAITFLLQA